MIMSTSHRGALAALVMASVPTFGSCLDTDVRAMQRVDRGQFDVASVKPNKSGGIPNVIAFLPGGRFTATNTALRELIRVAYGVQPSQLIDGPEWIGSSRFDVAARAETDGRPSLAMIRHLLEERFQLATHRETRELPLYALVVARGDRRLGPQLRVSDVDCTAAVTTGPSADGRQHCDSFTGAPPRWSAAGVTMAQIALALSRQARATVVDRSGLTGSFDVELQWTPEGLPRRPDNIDVPLRLNGFVVDPNGPSIFTAIEEQLGLKLDSGKGPVDVVVIDSVSQPSPD
jgi:uncharacterized protein (TIGR03435 family)